MFCFFIAPESKLDNHWSSFRIAAIFGLLVPGFILSNAFIGVYTGLLAVPKYDVAIRSLEDVTSNPIYKPYVNKGSSTLQYIEVRHFLKITRC